MSTVCLVRTWTKWTWVGPSGLKSYSYLPKVFGLQTDRNIFGEVCDPDPEEVTSHAKFATCPRCIWFYEKEMDGAQGSASAARLAQVQR